MAITVREVLALDIFVQASAEVMAGEHALDREVRWVHVSELSDIAHLLEGGELLLTTGLELAGNAKLQRKYVQQLAQVGVAGIVVELGRTFGELPPALVRQAHRDGVPLIALHREVRFVEITELVHSTIINREYEVLQTANTIRRDFTSLVLSGASVQRIVHQLADIVANPVVLEDAAHQVIEFATHAGTVDTLLRSWETHSRTGHESSEATARILDRAPRCAWMPVVLRDEIWGRLHILEQDSPLHEMNLLALDCAASMLGLTMLADRDVHQPAQHARGALISDILHGRYGASTEVLRRARALGADFEGKTLAVLAVEPRHVPEMLDEHHRSEDERQRVREAMLDDVRKAIVAVGYPVLATLEGDRVLVLTGAGRGVDLRAALDCAGGHIRTRIARRTAELKIAIGVSGETDIESVSRAFEEAKEALRYGLRIGGDAVVYHFGNLGLQHLLLRLSEGPELAQFVESELGALLEHDARSGTPLLPTLRVYLDTAGKSAAAKQLHIERRSLYHRLERIRGLLYRDLDDPEMRARLMVALRGLDVLHQRTPATNR